jgi:hypothetical protein
LKLEGFENLSKSEFLAILRGFQNPSVSKAELDMIPEVIS